MKYSLPYLSFNKSTCPEQCGSFGIDVRNVQKEIVKLCGKDMRSMSYLVTLLRTMTI